MKVMEQSEERLSRINAYNKLVDAAILAKTSSKSVADIVNHELGIECNAANVQEIPYLLPICIKSAER